MNLGGSREHSGHKGYCLAAMVDILCAVLSGGRWGPTVDGLPAAAPAAADGEGAAAQRGPPPPQEEGGVMEEGGDMFEAIAARDEDAAPTGIGHFFGCLRIDGFRDPGAFKRTIDQWIATFRGCEPVDPSQPVLVPGDPEWAAVDERERLGIPVKYSVLADLLEVAKASGVAPPFDAAAVDLSGVTRVVLEKT